MKWMIASDLHGSYFYASQMQQAFEREQADRLLLLGDLLYHGPRNDLPEGYAPKQVMPLLNGMKDRLLCVRGNCDAEVDQMVLNSRCWQTMPCCRWADGWCTLPTAMSTTPRPRRRWPPATSCCTGTPTSRRGSPSGRAAST